MNGNYPDKEEAEAKRAYDKKRYNDFATHKQPCPCASCYTIRADREWSDSK